MLNMAMYQLQYLKNLLAREEGQDLVEYALLLGLISLVAVLAITNAGTAVNNIWLAIVGMLNAVPGA